MVDTDDLYFEFLFGLAATKQGQQDAIDKIDTKFQSIKHSLQGVTPSELVKQLQREVDLKTCFPVDVVEYAKLPFEGSYIPLKRAKTLTERLQLEKEALKVLSELGEDVTRNTVHRALEKKVLKLVHGKDEKHAVHITVIRVSVE